MLMKKSFIILLVVLTFYGCKNKAENIISKMVNTDKIEKAGKKLRHVVLFKFKATSTPSDIEKVEEAFLALPSKIKEIKGFEWGLNNSPEGINKGFTHCYFLTFNSEEGRAIYLPHPEHLAFGKILSPHLEDVLVVDYWTK
jgi:hypothetical protein